MKISKRAKREANQLFRFCLVDGRLDENRVRQVVQRVVAAGHRDCPAILSHFRRLVRLDLARHTATIESATPLPADLQVAVEAGLTRELMEAKLLEARRDASRNAYGLYAGGKFWFFELKDREIMSKLAPERTAAWRSLDVAVLHEVVLEHLLGIDKPAQAAKTNLSYDRLADVSIARVDKGTHQAALFMNPTKLEQIREVAGKGEVMPQKSTDFYPKLIDGMVACQVDLGTKR